MVCEWPQSTVILAYILYTYTYMNFETGKNKGAT